jgi:hypothetical protein
MASTCHRPAIDLPSTYRSARTPWLSEAEEFQGKLVLGSWYNDFLAVAEREPQP